MPADDKSDGTRGNRGIYLATNAVDVVNHVLDVYTHDLDPDNHKDIRRFDLINDAPPPGYIPDYTSGGTS